MANTDPPRAQAGEKPRLLERMLAPFAKVEPGEAGVALLMTLTVFLVLCAYYVLKPAREALIIPTTLFGIPGAELKSYAGAAMAVMFVFIIPAYGILANKVGRLKLINICYSIVLACLVGFFLLANIGFKQIGIAFFIWLGLINMFLVAQFWSYANDLYTEEQGKRLFAIIAIGGSLGAIAGPQVAKMFGVNSGMLVAAALLLVCLVLFNLINKLNAQKAAHNADDEKPVGGPDGFKLVVSDRYLLLIALMVLIANLVNTTGEYLLSHAASLHAEQLVPAAAGVSEEALKGKRGAIIGAFYADFYFWVNLIGFIVQAFIVSRVFKWFGVRVALFVLPLVAFGGYGAMAMIGGLVVVRLGKGAENSMDYSIQNTVRQALFLKTSRTAKYKAKAAIDTFFLRAGDALSGLLVFVCLRALSIGDRGIATINVVLVVAWLLLTVGIAREHKRLEDKGVGDDADKEKKPA